MNRHAKDDLLVGQALRSLAAELSAELAVHSAPSASAIWFRAQRERRRLALDRAMRPLRVMQTLALLCPVLLAALLLHQYSRLTAKLLQPPMLEWAALALLLALTGVAAMLHLARQSSRTALRR